MLTKGIHSIRIPFLAVLTLFAAISLLFTELFADQINKTNHSQWNEGELALLKMNWLENLPEAPQDPSNKFLSNLNAAKLGHKLFFDRRFSKNGEIACASCHIPEKFFTDGLGRAKGIDESLRSTPTLIGIAHSPWFFWDGSSDSLWSQALHPLESSIEHGGNRSQYAHIIYKDAAYKKLFENVFGPMPDLSNLERFPKNAAPLEDEQLHLRWEQMAKTDQELITAVFVSLGKALAAYQRLLQPADSRFDRYVAALVTNKESDALNNEEIAGLKLFIGKAQCITCHQGPLFSNHGFHNVGAPDPAENNQIFKVFNFFKEDRVYDLGRYKGVRLALDSQFNCLGPYSDANEKKCGELKFANTKHTNTLGAFKVPTLRNIVETAPYFHSGQFKNLQEVLEHYNRAPDAAVGHNELTPLELSKKELKQLEAFLHTLSSPLDVSANWLQDPH